MRHFLEVDDLSGDELVEVLDRAEAPVEATALRGRGVALLFEKPSARTRSSTEVAVAQLGGHPVTIRPEEVGLDVRETVEDVTRTLACFHVALGARVHRHATLERMAACDVVPVVNLLSDEAHPLQALADLLTLRGHFGGLDALGGPVAWVGDGNNVFRSFALVCALAGIPVRVAGPDGYRPCDADLERIRRLGGDVTVLDRPEAAVEGAVAVSTDVWTSMGQEDEATARRAAFAGWTVDGRLMDRAVPGAVFLHCLPAHRGEEVAAEVVDGPRSLVWAQATNRMHAARGLLAWLLEAA